MLIRSTHLPPSPGLTWRTFRGNVTRRLVRKDVNETTARPLQLVPSSNHEKRSMPKQHIKRVALLAALLVSATFAARADEAVPRQTLTFGGIKRTYVVRAPADLPRSGPRVPLVLVLHGGGNAVNAEQMTGFTEKARKEGFIVACPEGTGRLKDKLLTWNAGHCCGYAMKRNVDDVGFVNALIDTLVQSYPADTRRIYATGMSNGGMMTHRLGIRRHRAGGHHPVWRRRQARPSGIGADDQRHAGQTRAA